MMSCRLLLISALMSSVACTTDEPVDKDAGDTDETAVEPDAEPPPGPLTAGFARRRIPAPVGINIAGNGPFGAPANPTPFADVYPGTKRIHGHPEMKALAISRGRGHEVVFLRVDAIGMFSQLRNDIVAKASAIAGRDLDDVVVIGATHTHSGPGSVVNTGTSDSSFFDIIADRFQPDFYERFVDAAVESITGALDDLAPARVAFTTATCAEGHNDRRCEDGLDYTNDAVPLIAVEREGLLDVVMLAYAVHGTVIGLDELHLSQDVHGAIEEAVEERFDRPVEVMSFNSWGGDMSPNDPGDLVPTRTGANRGSSYARLRKVGWVVADSVMPALEGLTWEEEPVIDLETHRVRIDRTEIGYDDETFENYDYGAVYCQLGEQDCDDPKPIEGMDDACIPFNESFPAPTQTSSTIGQIGPWALVTFPGEPGTLLAELLMDEVREAMDDSISTVLFLGYAQDYLGYSILPDDWVLGGYEASGALWGPQQGIFLVNRILDQFPVWRGEAEAEDEPAILEPFPYTLDPWVPETALTPNTVITDVEASYTADETVAFTIAGLDPWVGTPTAHVVDGAGTRIMRRNGMPLDSDTLYFDVRLEVAPPYTEAQPEPGAPLEIVRMDRTFQWTFTLAVQEAYADLSGLALGAYRIEVEVPQLDGSTETVQSELFTVSAD